MVTHFRNYYEDCEWSLSTETYSREELGKLAISPAVEFRHDINSEFVADLTKSP